MRCFRFISRFKAGDIKTTGQYMTYHRLSNLQFRLLLKNFSHSVHIDLRDTSGEKISSVFVGITHLLSMSAKPTTFNFNLKDVTRWLLQKKYKFQNIEVLIDNVDGFSVQLHKLLEELQFPSQVLNLVPVAKCVGADLFDSATPDVVVVVSGR